MTATSRQVTMSAGVWAKQNQGLTREQAVEAVAYEHAGSEVHVWRALNLTAGQPGQIVMRHIHGKPIHEWRVVRYLEREDAYLLEVDTPHGIVSRCFGANEVTL